MIKRTLASRNFLTKNFDKVTDLGVTINQLRLASEYAYHIIDSLDETLTQEEADKLVNLIELTSLSAMIGHLLSLGIEKYSDGNFKRNEPHTFPDLLATTPNFKDIEIKVALESNKPKGHLAKEGFYLVFRYVLADEYGEFIENQRGNWVTIWEIRAGFLEEKHFNLSNTPGDSGKTAHINQQGMDSLFVLYCDLTCCPHPKGGKNYKMYQQLFIHQK